MESYNNIKKYDNIFFAELYSCFQAVVSGFAGLLFRSSFVHTKSQTLTMLLAIFTRTWMFTKRETA